MEALYTFLSDKMFISKEDWEEIKQVVQEQEICKKDFLLQQGKIEKCIYFILDGVFRIYIENIDKEITIDFGFPNSFISSYSSFLKQTPSNCNVQALTKGKVLYITHSDLETIYSKTKCGHALGRTFAEEFFLYKSKREESFMTEPPQERYLKLFEEQPNLIEKIPGKYIASYIGITPQALSRIRNRIY
ncbi:MAG: Crp/Fnr family transcriptional regulator [Flavobacteriales bacterium]|nr:Crp/Fnr family transcriptional regulator [Flavobacteriales bacterium]